MSHQSDVSPGGFSLPLSSSEFILPVKKRVCNICTKKLANYTCPKCNCVYCDLNCYKSEVHRQCSETFYKDLLEDELKSPVECNKEEQARLLQLLQEYELGSWDESTEEHLDLEDRLADLDLEAACFESIWSRLTVEEQQEFRRITSNLSSQELQSLVEVWEPWWSPKSIQMLSQEPESCLNRQPEILILKNSTTFSVDLKSNNAKLLLNNAVNIMFGYTLCTRFLNGLLNDKPEACQLLWITSRILESNDKFAFDSVSMSIQDVIVLAMESPNIKATTAQCITCIKDVEFLFSSIPNLQSALSDLYRCFDNFKNSEYAKSKHIIKKSFLSMKKVEFFLRFMEKLQSIPTGLISIREMQLQVESVYNKQLRQFRRSHEDSQLGNKLKEGGFLKLI